MLAEAIGLFLDDQGIFHPRQQNWDDNLRWDSPHIVGESDIGRITIRVLCMNSDEQLELRMAGE